LGCAKEVEKDLAEAAVPQSEKFRALEAKPLALKKRQSVRLWKRRSSGMTLLSRFFKSALPPLPRWRAQVILSTLRSLRYRAVPLERCCNICGQTNLFQPFGWPLRPEALCPHCGSLERHRLLKLWLDNNRARVTGKKLLHFAAEPIISTFLRPIVSQYVTADIEPGRDLQLNIEKIDLPNESFDLIFCVHVLEHVDDRSALAEMHRVLAVGGIALLMTPIVEGWAGSYEDKTISEPSAREIHFGQEDHLRFFGSDIRKRILQAGFALEEFTPEGADAVRYGLTRGEKVFIATPNA
jgi:SAM-dependent methyltransferase